MDHHLDQLLHERFGFEAFRPHQKESIECLLRERRVLCIQPTGYGKSLLYQLPALLFDGLTLVISPLLALMRDQIRQLNERFDVPAASINSDQSDEENEAAQQLARSRRIRILFIAPEKLDNLEMVNFLYQLDVAMVVVDEAHCISTWGHDFRPAYRQIVNAVRAFEAKNPDLHVLGLTATANRRTEQDIAVQLRDPAGRSLTVLRLPMDRPNLSLSVIPVADLSEKLARLAALLSQLEGSGILYCATREQTEIVAGYLRQQGLDVVSYHAGYDGEQKRQLQQAFMAGQHKAIAATNALGMGIDKPDIRFILHVDVPGSITAYYQEVGRAGRDGRPAEGILLFEPQDRRIQDHFIRSAQPTIEDFQTVLSHLQPDRDGAWPTLSAIRIRCGLHPTRVTIIMAELVEQGLVEKRLVNRQQVYVRTGVERRPDLKRYERQQMVRQAELEAMLKYGRQEVNCLMQALRLALGDKQAGRCRRCSRCRPSDLMEAINREDAQVWLAQRDVPIPASKRPPMSAGLSVLNGDLRGQLFVHFMRRRASADWPALAPELQALLKQKVASLQQQYEFGAVLAVPSHTWQQRDFTAQFVADLLDAGAYPHLLAWQTEPAQRQGDLLNNDQRRDNVAKKMQLTGLLVRPGAPPPTRAILLLDDYIGSGATIKEAVRVLRQDGGFPAAIVPLTIARIRWRLGAKGMI
ncbi:MAG TPA: RecQ family ATP-dependent DNA helicase [Anaerolineae bacterium]